MTKLPALIWLFIITGLSTNAGVAMPKFNLFEVDKLGHAAAYGLLVWLILFGFHKSWPSTRIGVGAAAFLFATAYGALMEIVQYAFFPGRLFELDDMLANAAGAALAWLTFNRIVRLIPNRQAKSP